MTFVELVVVLGIFATITGVVLFNFTGFTTNVTLQNLANQIAKQFKQAQSDSLVGKNALSFSIYSCPTPANPSATCRPSYGLYFDSAPANNKKFVYFADYDNSGDIANLGAVYSSCGLSAECLTEIQIGSGDVLNKTCVLGSGALACSGAGTPLSVTFRRPFPDANFAYGGTQGIENAQIEILSPRGTFKKIVIWSTGQIEIKNGPIATGSIIPPPAQ